MDQPPLCVGSTFAAAVIRVPCQGLDLLQEYTVHVCVTILLLFSLPYANSISLLYSLVSRQYTYCHQHNTYAAPSHALYAVCLPYNSMASQYRIIIFIRSYSRVYYFVVPISTLFSKISRNDDLFPQSLFSRSRDEPYFFLTKNTAYTFLFRVL